MSFTSITSLINTIRFIVVKPVLYISKIGYAVLFTTIVVIVVINYLYGFICNNYSSVIIENLNSNSTKYQYYFSNTLGLTHNLLDINIYLFPYILLIIISIAIIPYTTLLGLYGVFVALVIPLFLFSYILLFYSLFMRCYNITTHVVLGQWFFTSIGYEVMFDLKIDHLSASFAALTSNIGFFALSYAFSYFRGEPHIPRLLILIQFFIISMILFVFASNLVVLFLGWELIGLTSFLLINFWTTKAASLKSSFKALYFNRWSDTFIMLFMFLCFTQFGTLDVDVIINELWYITEYNFKYLNYNHETSSNGWSDQIVLNIPYMLFIFLVLGASIKSAQFICHIWLPDSMEAPVPASALIHSATLVSAGIYLLLRFTELIHLLVSYNNYLILWGAVTALYGGVCACSQNDLKRILAYSTISHCGNMFLLASAGFSDLTMMYLYIHGYFKALSFLCVGNIIRFYKNVQDLRKMGMSVYYLPLDSLALGISLINLGGLPLTLGFYLKHYMLAFISLNSVSSVIISVSLIGTSVTGFLYSLKIIFHVFFDIKKGSINTYAPNESKSLISKFSNSTSYALIYMFLLAFLTTYFICIFLLSLENPALIENGGYFDGLSILTKSRQPHILAFKSEQFLVNGFLPIFIILLLIDYNYHANWRYVITEKKGTLVIYYLLLSGLLYPIHLHVEGLLQLLI